MVSCPECGGAIGPANPRFFDVPAMLHQGAYLWFVLVSALDLLLTGVVLQLHGGEEVNPIARAVIEHTGYRGLIGFKFAIVVFVIVMCEWVGRRQPRMGVKLAEWAVAITTIPVVVSLWQLFMH